LGDLLKEKGFNPSTRAGGVYVVITDELNRPAAMKIIQNLRNVLNVKIEYSLPPLKMGRQFQRAEESGCEKAIIIDTQTEQTGLVSVKDLATREQEIWSVEDLTVAKLFPSS
jgi:histidyl-tRNA synthetase